ncbi:hypothetical protein K431DRAFT_343491 [Polychaeton citri CBS 116435]|uniref:Uncharacterized protein n=1 Tax=Polychaeton citri CBS 116435 TaxID=1314669 RepID=A0A9P4QD32_9PEZI|nr:hypothetical protein K431DRAFT_343491 [Polychaeton citri CBS 116435]
MVKRLRHYLTRYSRYVQNLLDRPSILRRIANTKLARERDISITTHLRSICLLLDEFSQYGGIGHRKRRSCEHDPASQFGLDDYATNSMGSKTIPRLDELRNAIITGLPCGELKSRTDRTFKSDSNVLANLDLLTFIRYIGMIRKEKKDRCRYWSDIELGWPAPAARRCNPLLERLVVRLCRLISTLWSRLRTIPKVHHDVSIRTAFVRATLIVHLSSISGDLKTNDHHGVATRPTDPIRTQQPYACTEMSIHVCLASTHGEIHDWRPPRSQPSKRPELAVGWWSDASSLLNGMEPSDSPVPPFQMFVQRNAPASSTDSRPVPFTQRRRSLSVPVAYSRGKSSAHYFPITRRHSYSESLPSTHASLRAFGPLQDGPSAEEFMATNRSSSVYSRSSDHVDSDRFSWHTSDFADHERLPPQQAALDIGPIQLHHYRRHSPQQYPARLCSPLVPSPSPPHGRSHSPKSLQSQDSVLLIPLPISPEIPETSLKAVPLDSVRQLARPPSGPYWSPEEPYVSNASSSRSQEVLRFEPGSFSPAETHAVLSGPATLISLDGRRRLLSSLRRPRVGGFTANKTQTDHEYSNSSPDIVIASKSGTRDMTTLTNQSRAESKAKAAQALGLDMIDEPRGRTKRRGPRRIDYSHYTPKTTVMDSETDSEESEASSPHEDARMIAKQYHAVLTEQYHQPRPSSTSGSDENVKKHTRMAPQPLFINKPLPRPPSLPQSPMYERVHSSFTDSSQSGDRHHAGQSGTASDIIQPPNGSAWAPGIKYSDRLTFAESYQSMQASGSIPNFSSRGDCQRSPEGSSRGSSGTDREYQYGADSAPDSRASAYYPHPMHRHWKTGSSEKPKSKHTKSDSKLSSNGQGLMLEADIVAQRSSTPDTEGFGLQQQVFPTPPSGRASTDTYHSAPSSPPTYGTLARPADMKRSFHQRVTGDASRYHDIGGRSPPTPPVHPNPLLCSPVISEEGPPQMPLTPWPRFEPSRVETQSPRLGWSMEAKRRFDKKNSLRAGVSQRGVWHHTATSPHGVVDIRDVGRRDGEDVERVNRRRPNKVSEVLEQLMDFRREQKAEKRRNELRKMIRIVPQQRHAGNDAWDAS